MPLKYERKAYPTQANVHQRCCWSLNLLQPDISTALDSTHISTMVMRMNRAPSNQKKQARSQKRPGVPRTIRFSAHFCRRLPIGSSSRKILRTKTFVSGAWWFRHRLGLNAAIPPALIGQKTVPSDQASHTGPQAWESCATNSSSSHSIEL